MAGQEKVTLSINGKPFGRIIDLDEVRFEQTTDGSYCLTFSAELHMTLRTVKGRERRLKTSKPLSIVVKLWNGQFAVEVRTSSVKWHRGVNSTHADYSVVLHPTSRAKWTYSRQETHGSSQSR